MDRNRRVYLCARSLANISMDLKDDPDFSDYSDMILFIAKKITEKMAEQTEDERYQVHGEGKIHMTVMTDKQHEECIEAQEEIGFGAMNPETYNESTKEIEKEVDDAIKAVRSNLNAGNR